MSRKKILASLLILALVSMITPIVSAAPYAEYTIAASGETVILATDFDDEPFEGWEGSDGAQAIRAGHDVRTEVGGSEHGGNIGWIAAGNWVQYTVTFAEDGYYSFEASLATDSGSPGGVKLYIDDIDVGTSDDAENLGGWQAYDWYHIANAPVAAGTRVLKTEYTGGHNISAIRVTPATWEAPNTRIGRSGTTVIKAVDFDADSYGKAGADGNQTIRQGHDVRTEIGGSGFGNIGWIGAGDWVQYTVTVANDGMYAFAAMLASDSGDRAPVIISVGDSSVTAGAPADSTGWQDYQLMPADGEIEMTAGDHVIRVEFGGGVNFAALNVNRTGDIPSDEPEPVPAAEPADEAGDEPAGDDGETPAAGDTGSSSSDSDDEGNMILWIIIAVVAVVIIVVIVIFAAKKKKA